MRHKISQMRQFPTVRAAALTGFSALARDFGLDPNKLLRRTGLPADVERDPDRRLPAKAVNKLLEEAATAAGIEDFGLKLAELRGFSNLGPVTVLARDEPDIRSALAIFTTYLPLHNEALSIELTEQDGLAILSSTITAQGIRVQATDVAVAMLNLILRQLMGSSWRPLGIYLERPAPIARRNFARSFGTDIHFAQDFSGVVFAAADLERPNLLAQSNLRPYTAPLRDSLQGLVEISLSARITRLIRPMLASGRCTALLTAERLGLSRRTMERRLSDEGTTFHRLLDDVRSEAACGQLSGTNRSNSEIAELTGFASSAAFTAWFSSRHGTSPQMWRKKSRLLPDRKHG